MSSLSCPDCGSGHTTDQRYCVECGRRLRALPHGVAITLASLARGRRLAPESQNATAASTGGALSSTQSERHRFTLWGQPVEVPSARALAVTVLAVIAFGVIVGTTNFSNASQSLALEIHEPAPAARVPTPPVSGNTGVAPAVTGNTGASSSGASAGSGASSPSSSSSSSSSGGSTSATTGSGSSSSDNLPPIKHVWVVELGDQGYAQTFEKGSPDTYLNTTLAKQGEVVPFLYASATSDLANEVGLISGQGPTVQTEADCPKYTAIKPGAKATATAAQVKGDGCVYPASTPSLLSELTQAHDTWKAYVQGLGAGASAGCQHPSLGASDGHYAATSTGAYETWRNPVVYLANLTAEKTCGAQDTGMGALAGDLRSEAKTPTLSLILPNACDDGSNTPCRAGAPAGTARSDTFLKSVIPEIEASPAYKAGGMILVTFAQAPQGGPDPDQSSCCDQVAKFPNLPSANYESATAPGVSTPAAPTTTTTQLGTTTLSVTPTGTGAATSTTPATTSTTPVTTTTTGATTTGATTTSTTTCSTTGTTSTPAATTTTAPSATTTSGTGTTTTGATDGDCACPTGASTVTTPTGTTTTTALTTTTLGTGTTSTTPASCTSTTTSGESGEAKATGGGGQVGMLVLSKYVSKNLQDGSDYFSTFSITGSLEQLFGLKYTGYAATTGLPLFSGFFYSNFSS